MVARRTSHHRQHRRVTTRYQQRVATDDVTLIGADSLPELSALWTR